MELWGERRSGSEAQGAGRASKKQVTITCDDHYTEAGWQGAECRVGERVTFAGVLVPTVLSKLRDFAI